MIVQGFFTLVAIEFSTLVAIVVSIYLKYKIPAQEFNLVLICLLFEISAHFSYSLIYYLSSPTISQLSQFSVYLSSLGYFLSITAIMCITFVIILIDFRGTNHQLMEIIFLTWIGGVTAVYNGITSYTYLSHGSLETNYNPLGLLFILLFFSFVVFIWVKRFIQISRVYNLHGSRKVISTELALFILIGVTLVLLYFVLVLVLNLRGDYSFIASGILTIVGMGALVKNNSFLFVTDIHLDSIIIIEKESGLRLYSKTFNSADSMKASSDTSDFIGSIISTISATLSNTIQSQNDLTELSFSDKTVLIYSGDIVRSILIVSSSNLIAKGISKHLVKKFEKYYGETINQKLVEKTFYSRKSDYNDFENEVDYVREFLPL